MVHRCCQFWRQCSPKQEESWRRLCVHFICLVISILARINNHDDDSRLDRSRSGCIEFCRKLCPLRAFRGIDAPSSCPPWPCITRVCFTTPEIWVPRPLCRRDRPFIRRMCNVSLRLYRMRARSLSYWVTPDAEQALHAQTQISSNHSPSLTQSFYPKSVFDLIAT